MSPAQQTPAFALQGVGAQLGGLSVLHDLSLQLPQGRWTAIVGPNGACKSTLLKVLAGLLPHSGQVRLLDRTLAAWTNTERARAMAWLGQNEVAADDLRAYDVVMLGRLPHQAWLAAPNEADHAAVAQAMHMTQTWDWRERSLGQLSGGERQRVLLARALAVQASVLLMDEPLMHLDPPHQADWLALVHDLVRAGTTVLSVLHEISVALQADDLLIMHHGRVLHQGAAHDAATHRALERVFEQRIAIHPVGAQWVALPNVNPPSTRSAHAN
jgi:iron complex transport system ATP-binding protein